MEPNHPSSSQNSVPPETPVEDLSGAATGAEEAPELEPLPFPYVSVVLLLLNTALFLLMWKLGRGEVSRVAYLFGDKENALIRAGQWWRLITPIFLHGGWEHLLANSLTLVLLGMPMERIYGARKYFLVYMLAGIAGNVSSYWFSTASSLGASGALYGLMGAGLVFPLRFGRYIDPRARKAFLTQLAWAAFINLSINFWPNTGLNLDKFAHIGGMIGGGLAALLWLPDVLEEEAPSPLQHRALWSAAALMLLTVLLAGWQQWQFARHTVRSVASYYTLNGDDPWWGLQIPSGWLPRDTVGQEGVEWQGPNQARLQILDNQDDSLRLSQAEDELKAHRAQESPYPIDGKNGIKAVYREGDKTVELHRIETDGHAINILLTCPTSAWPRVQPMFEAMLGSIRFVHAPRIK